MDKPLQGYLLHRRLFRDSSLIIDLFTYEQGYISAIAKGARRQQSKLRAGLQFFQPISILLYGRSELLNIKSAEVQGKSYTLTGEFLFSMLYVNELLIKLLHKFEPHPAVYQGYQILIEKFSLQQAVEENLRKFEWTLLQELGYGLNIFVQHYGSSSLDEEADYLFHWEEGLSLAQSKSENTYSGKALVQIYYGHFTEPSVLLTAKRLFRQIFNSLLQNKTINSRQLFLAKKLSISNWREQLP